MHDTNFGVRKHPGIALAPADAGLPAILSKVSWRYVPFLMICYGFAYLDRVNIGFAKMEMAIDLRLSETIYGLGAGIFFVGYFLFEVPSNIMLQRYGARRWISRILVSWALVSAAMAFIDSVGSFYLLRFMLGVAEAGFFPGVVLFLSQWFPSARRAQIIALFMTAIPISGLLGAPLSGAIIQTFDGWAGMAGWRWMFILEALPALGLGLLALRVLDSRIAEADWLPAHEKDALTKALSADAQSTSHARTGLGALTDRTVLMFAFIYFCCIMGQYGITFWLPTLVKAAGADSPLSVGFYTAIPYAFAVVSMIVVGRHSDATGERRWHTMTPMVIGALALAAAPFATANFVPAMVLVTIAASAVLTATPMFWTLPTQVLRGDAAVVGIAGINSVGNLAGFVSPFLVGWLADRSGSTVYGMALLGGFLLCGASVLGARVASEPKR